MAAVIPISASPKAFMSNVRRLARSSSTVVLPTEHVQNPDEISPLQIFYLLEEGELSHGPTYNEHNDVTGELRTIAAGEEIIGVVVIEDGKLLRVLHVEKRL